MILSNAKKFVLLSTVLFLLLFSYQYSDALTVSSYAWSSSSSNSWSSSSSSSSSNANVNQNFQWTYPYSGGYVEKASPSSVDQVEQTSPSEQFDTSSVDQELSINSIIDEGKKYLGTPYVFGGMDCSYFTSLVFSKFGYSLPDDPALQIQYGDPVYGTPQAGDLVFWDEYGNGYATHVGIAVGDGTVIHASSYYGDVTISDMSYIHTYIGARRL